LVVKQRLFNAHELLIWENVDNPGKTASLEKLNRLERLEVGVSASDLAAIRTAIRWRNTITHYEVDRVAEEVRENFLLIFEFLDSFHQTNFHGSLSERISDEHVPIAMALAESFNKEFIEFRGREMHRRWPRRLLAAQNIETMVADNEEFARVRWGAEKYWSVVQGDPVTSDFCFDCGAAIGELHGPFCDQEECPRCGGQLIGCDCEMGSDLAALDADETERSAAEQDTDTSQ
jgi:hypothetical protein